MSSPYATVVLPVHARSATLPAALASVQEQSVRELEILVAGDGAEREVRELVLARARADPRIRFLDRPKGEGRGEANRDHAVRSARSARLFYVDDDDVLLRDHVATLGAALDGVDVAESLPASGRAGGRVAVGATNLGAPHVRALLTTGRIKLNYDTHLAHTADAYRRLPRGWYPHPEGRPVWRLFAQLAELPGLRVRVVPAVTAISLHSPPRTGWTPAMRRQEIEGWLHRARGGLTGAELLAGSDWVPHALALLQALDVTPADTVGTALARIDVALEEPGGGTVVLPVPARERERLTQLLRFLRAELRDPAVAEDLLRSLLEPLLAPDPPRAFLQARLADCLGAAAAAEVLAAADTHRPGNAKGP